MNSRRCLSYLLLALLLILLPGPVAATAGTVRVVQLAESINPVVADFIDQQLVLADREQAAAFLLELDTPGGLDTAMRSIIQKMLAAQTAVIVYVAPAGARAASAGALITLAADFAAMAPGTNLGAAHPVSIGPGGLGGDKPDDTMTEKVVNDAVAYARSLAERRGRNQQWAESIVRESVSTPASEALKLGVIDLVAESREQLLQQLDGRSYRRGGEELTLRTAGAGVVFGEMSLRQRILNALGNPNVAYMLLMLGILGIFFEISQPGVIFPGAIGALALLLAFFALQTLPVNYVGVLLILLGLILFLLEVKVPSYGMLTVGGILALTFGSLMLIGSDEPTQQISRGVIAATVTVCSAFFILAVTFVVRTQRTRFVSGAEGMVGERGRAVEAFTGQGRVFVHSEYWDAVCDQPLQADDPVEIVRLLPNMRIEVRKLEKPGSSSRQGEA